MLIFPVKVIPGTTVGKAIEEAMNFCNKYDAAVDLMMGPSVTRIVPGPITKERISAYGDQVTEILKKHGVLNGHSKKN